MIATFSGANKNIKGVQLKQGGVFHDVNIIRYEGDIIWVRDCISITTVVNTATVRLTNYFDEAVTIYYGVAWDSSPALTASIVVAANSYYELALTNNTDLNSKTLKVIAQVEVDSTLYETCYLEQVVQGPEASHSLVVEGREATLTITNTCPFAINFSYEWSVIEDGGGNTQVIDDALISSGSSYSFTIENEGSYNSKYFSIEGSYYKVQTPIGHTVAVRYPEIEIQGPLESPTISYEDRGDGRGSVILTNINPAYMAIVYSISYSGYTTPNKYIYLSEGSSLEVEVEAITIYPRLVYVRACAEEGSYQTTANQDTFTISGLPVPPPTIYKDTALSSGTTLVAKVASVHDGGSTLHYQYDWNGSTTTSSIYHASTGEAAVVVTNNTTVHSKPLEVRAYSAVSNSIVEKDSVEVVATFNVAGVYLQSPVVVSSSISANILTIIVQNSNILPVDIYFHYGEDQDGGTLNELGSGSASNITSGNTATFTITNTTPYMKEYYVDITCGREGETTSRSDFNNPQIPPPPTWQVVQQGQVLSSRPTRVVGVIEAANDCEFDYNEGPFDITFSGAQSAEIVEGDPSFPDIQYVIGVQAVIASNKHVLVYVETAEGCHSYVTITSIKQYY